ncbi:MAG: hypothetical protein KC493_08200 [Bacteriovoracaceae bacterium]|nr:hypothetical protein [Bacteriovoracaceae bacterium]
MKLTYSLNEYSENVRKEFIGEKAYNLMAMMNKGINIPEGFVLSTESWNKKDSVDLASLIDSELENIKSTYVMVRSSAIGEDGEDFSFAGQLDSFQVKNDKKEIISGIKKCWDSLGNNRSETYGEFNGKKLSKMGVVVQAMIEPEYAGVMFTSSPQNPNLKLIEYVEGHCEKLVSGQVTPDSVTLPFEGEKKPPFLDKLSKETENILEFYKEHQDIEWAYKDNEIYIVQSRPITTISNKTHWSSTNVNENYPEKLSPLLYSIARRSYYFYFKNLCREFKIKLNSESESDFYNIIGLWGDRMYYNMTSIHHVIALTPFKSLLKKSFDNFVGYQKEFNSKDRLSGHIDKLLFVLRAIKHGVFLKSYVERVENRVSKFTSKENNKNLKSLFHDFLDIRFNFWVNASYSDFYAMLSHGALGKYLELIKVENASGLQNSLVQSIPNLISNKPIFELWKIKKFISEKNHTELFSENSSADIYSELTQNGKYSDLNQMIQVYLKDWGFRCSGELTFLSENYIENPASFIEMLKGYLKAENQDPKIQFDKKQKEQQVELGKVTKKLPLLKSLTLKFLVKFTMFSISCRERVRLKQAHAYSQFKAVCLNFGKQLVKNEILKTQSDIFYLEYDEISRLLNQEFYDKEYLNSLIDLRKSKIEKSIEYPESFHSDNVNSKNSYVDQDETISLSENAYKGLPACGGVIKARAVVLDSIHEIGKLKKGDILITKQTDPGWICAFPLISGLVVERGGMLSHGAIVAREFGIPAVVGLKDITKIINTDDIITIDGNQGIVECQTV